MIYQGGGCLQIFASSGYRTKQMTEKKASAETAALNGNRTSLPTVPELSFACYLIDSNYSSAEVLYTSLHKTYSFQAPVTLA